MFVSFFEKLNFLFKFFQNAIVVFTVIIKICSYEICFFIRILDVAKEMLKKDKEAFEKEQMIEVRLLIFFFNIHFLRLKVTVHSMFYRAEK